MIDELIEWLLAQIADDETVVRAVAARKWSRYLEGGDDGWAIESEPPGCDFIVGDDAASKHVALFDPKRMLDEVEAKRRLLNDFGGFFGLDEFSRGLIEHAIKLTALPYSDRPGFREEWRP